MNKIDTIANRIKERLFDLNMTQSDLVRATGINKATISQYLSGRYLPKQDRIEAIAEALKVDVVWLMGYDVPKAPFFKPEVYYNDKCKPVIANEPYYIDEGARMLAQELANRPELQVLFSASRDASREDIEAVAKILEKMTNKD